MLVELSEVPAERPQPPGREPPGGVPELSRASEARIPSHARPPALAHHWPGASRTCCRAPPSLTRGRLPVSSSMALLASFMALCSGFAAPSPAAAAMAPGGGGRGDRGGAGASEPERGVCSRGSCGKRTLPEGTGTHFRLPRPAAQS